jgi:hypothetical protein
MKLFSNLNEEYFYSGEDLESDLLKYRTAWEAQRTGINQYRFFSRLSAGTLRINNIPIPIKANAEVREYQEGVKSVLLFTSTRPEHYFIFILFVILCTLIPLTAKKEAWAVIFPLVLWFPTHIFFQFVIRVQEELLINNIVKNLRLKSIPDD